ncbi:hypothetical protein MXD58_018835, partial [Frankia sp. AgKG'84/4]|nr:hypothetical protein [Frankia sp. AgKG'84/4]
RLAAAVPPGAGAGAARPAYNSGGAVTTWQDGSLYLTGADGSPFYARDLLGSGSLLEVRRASDGQRYWHEWDAGPSGLYGDPLARGTRTFGVESDGATWSDHAHGTIRDVLVREGRTTLNKGLVRGERQEDGSWRWYRYNPDGRLMAQGIRTRDLRALTDLTPAGNPGPAPYAQRQYRSVNSFKHALHYREHSLVPDGTGGNQVDHTYKEISTQAKDVGRLEPVTGGHTLKITRWAEQRPPQFLWQDPDAISNAAYRQIARFFGSKWGQVDFAQPGATFADSRYQVYRWKEKAGVHHRTAPNVARGVRVMTPDGSFADFTGDGHFVRGEMKLENGHTVKIGAAAAGGWQSLQGNLPTGAPRTLTWTESGTTPALTGERHLLGGGPAWIDTIQPGGPLTPKIIVRHTDPNGNVVSYLGTHQPTYTPTAATPFTPTGTETTITRNTMGEIVARTDAFPAPTAPATTAPATTAPATVAVTGSGTPTRGTSWTWSDGTNVGTRISSRNHQWTGSWDDSYRDYQRVGGVQTRIRDMRSLKKGSGLFAWRDPATSTWQSQLRNADGVPTGVPAQRQWRSADGRTWQPDIPTGTAMTDWRDLDAAGDVVREQAGGRVREYTTPRPTHRPGGYGSWREYDQGDVFRERTETAPGSGVFRESEKFHKQWRETDAGGRLLRYRTLSGNVWERGPLGRLRLLPGTPRTLVGREFEYRGTLNQFRGYDRMWRESNRLQYTATDGLAGTFVSRSRVMFQKAAIEYGIEFGIDSVARLLATTGVNRAQVSGLDFARVFTAAAITALVKTANSVLHDVQGTPLKSWKDGLANVDGGKHYTRNPYNHDKHWDNEWAGPENPPRWRGTVYDYVQGTLMIGMLASFVATSSTSAIYGIPKDFIPLRGRDAATAGGVALAGSLVSGLVLGLVRTLAVYLSSGRFFHRAGSADLALTFAIRVAERSLALLMLRAAGLRPATPPSLSGGGQ